MKLKKIWANLGVSDLTRTNEFYTKLGFTANGQFSATNQLTSFLVGDDDFVIHFFLKDVLESNMKIKIADPKDGVEIMFTLSAESTKEVDNWAEEVQNAGGSIISGPAAFGQGYYGFVFSDPDGHMFNVFYM